MPQETEAKSQPATRKRFVLTLSSSKDVPVDSDISISILTPVKLRQIEDSDIDSDPSEKAGPESELGKGQIPLPLPFSAIACQESKLLHEHDWAALPFLRNGKYWPEELFVHGFKLKKRGGIKGQHIPFQYNDFRLNHPEHRLHVNNYQSHLYFIRKIKVMIVVSNGSYSTVFSVFFKQKAEHGPQSSTVCITRRELVVLRHNVICGDLYADDCDFVHDVAKQYVQRQAEEFFGPGPDYPSSEDVHILRV